MRKLRFSIKEYYHIYNRGVEKRDIFIDTADYFRFLLSIKDFNTPDSILHISQNNSVETKSRLNREDQPLVEVIYYCLMPNHFHLVLRQLENDGISKLMHKVGLGYTQYFNVKYKRSGVLFQGTFKAKHIESDAYLLHLSRYIHRNPLEIINSDMDTKERHEAEWLLGYKWSSFLFYLNKNKPCLIKLNTDIVLSQFRDEVEGYKNFVLRKDFESLELKHIKIE